MNTALTIAVMCYKNMGRHEIAIMASELPPVEYCRTLNVQSCNLPTTTLHAMARRADDTIATTPRDPYQTLLNDLKYSPTVILRDNLKHLMARYFDSEETRDALKENHFNPAHTPESLSTCTIGALGALINGIWFIAKDSSYVGIMIDTRVNPLDRIGVAQTFLNGVPDTADNPLLAKHSKAAKSKVPTK